MSQSDNLKKNNQMLLKEVSITVFSVCFFLALLYYLGPSVAINSKNTELHEKEEHHDTLNKYNKTISVSLVINTGTDIYIMQETIDENDTVFDLMQQAAKKNNFSFSYDTNTVKEIYGIQTNGDGSWQYKINDESIPASLFNTPLKNGDRVVWIYE